jgi:hypothetical protein
MGRAGPLTFATAVVRNTPNRLQTLRAIHTETGMKSRAREGRGFPWGAVAIQYGLRSFASLFVGTGFSGHGYRNA